MRHIATKAALTDDIKRKIAFVAGGDPSEITPQDLYQGTAHSVREELFDAFNKTNKYFEYVSKIYTTVIGFVLCIRVFLSHCDFPSTDGIYR
jgi:hypothetical protein